MHVHIGPVQRKPVSRTWCRGDIGIRSLTLGRPVFWISGDARIASTRLTYHYFIKRSSVKVVPAVLRPEREVRMHAYTADGEHHARDLDDRAAAISFLLSVEPRGLRPASADFRFGPSRRLHSQVRL